MTYEEFTKKLGRFFTEEDIDRLFAWGYLEFMRTNPDEVTKMNPDEYSTKTRMFVCVQLYFFGDESVDVFMRNIRNYTGVKMTAANARALIEQFGEEW